MIKHLSVVLALSAFGTTYPLSAGEKSPAAEHALKLVKDRLEDLKSPEAAVGPIKDFVASVFPEHAFVSVRFRLWPVAIAPPEPLQSQNLFAVDKNGKLTHLTGPKNLEAFFKKHARLVGAEKRFDKDEKGERKNNIKDVVGSWLRLSQEFVQDGFFKFTLVKDSIGITQTSSTNKSDEKRSLEGILSVVPEGGNKGTLSVEIQIDDQGRILGVSETNKVMAGIRPRCQATRLLDPDPVIRAICEQDLLVLGRAAHPYLMEQRASAGPELRQAIDRVWQRIVEEGR